MTASNWFWVPYELLINLFQAFLYTWFLGSLLTKKNREHISFYVCVLLTFLAYTLYLIADKLTIEIAFSTAWIKLIPSIYIFFFYRDSWWNKLLWIVTLFIIPATVIAFSYYGFALGSGQTFEWFLSPGIPRLIFTLSANGLLFASLFLIVRFFAPLKNDNFIKPRSVIVLIIIILAAYSSAEVMYTLYPQGDISNLLFFLTAFLSLIICLSSLLLYYFIFLSARKEAELSYIDGQSHAIDARLSEISEMYSMMQLMNHDIRKHLKVTETLLSQHDVEESRAYLAEVSNHLENLFSTGCLPLDSALTVRKKLLEQNKIGFIYELCDLQKLPLSASDFCAIIMNLLDNASEACERYYGETFEHFVKLSIRHHENMFFIECTNPCPNTPLQKKNGRYISLKKESGHGYGLLSIEHIVDKIHGICSFKQEGRYFKAYIALPYFEANQEEDQNTHAGGNPYKKDNIQKTYTGR